MRKLLLMAACTGGVAGLALITGCKKNELPPQQFVLTGCVRLHKEVKEDAKIEFEVCKGTEWLNKQWNTVTDKWGAYKIIVPSDWFGCYYRVRASAVDKHGNFYRSDWEYGIVAFTEATKDFWLGEEEERLKPEEKKEKRRRRRR